jgi:hypothetical protein
MKITRKQLSRIIREERSRLLEADQYGSPPGPGEQGSADEMPGEMHRVTNDSKGEVIGPFEYKLAAAIADEFEQHELSQKTQGTGPSWSQEVNNAGSELEEALLDSGALDSLLRLVDDIATKLHNGEYTG